MTAREKTTQEECYRLSQAPGGLGLHCEAGGVSLGGVSLGGVSLGGVALLRKSGKGFAPRPAYEIEALIKGAYGHERDLIRLASGLRVAADALNKGDVSRAMIAAVHLRLPDLSDDGAALMVRVDDILAKYDPDEPRDWRGRWTTGGAAGEAGRVKPRPLRTPSSSSPVDQRRGLAGSPHSTTSSAAPVETDAATASPNRSWGGPTSLYGGHLTNTAWPENEPLYETRPEPGPEPNFSANQVPQGFDTPGHIAGGLEYSPSRHPTLPNGEPWPEATPEHVLTLLRLQLGRHPYIYVYVSRDGVGPILSGSTPGQDLREPEGYDRVMFIGRPQFTALGNGESPHALASVIEGLRLARSNEFSTVLFNSTLSTIARYVESPYEVAVVSLLRPDVAAVTRPSLERPDRIVPYEVLSPGQRLETRREKMPSIPGIRLVDGDHYKRLERLTPAWFKRLEVRLLCL